MTNENENIIKVLKKFPDKNPNPVLRFSEDGILIYYNNPSEIIVKALNIKINERPDDKFQKNLNKAIKNDENSFEFETQKKVFNLKAVYVNELKGFNVYGTDITAKKVIDKFPDRNPNPVMRISSTGILIYFNDASSHIVSKHNLAIDKIVSGDIIESVGETILTNQSSTKELIAGTKTYLMSYVPVNEFDCVILYATDITASKLINKFPDQNPNPVLRLSSTGVLNYYNDASKYIIDNWKVKKGEKLPNTILDILYQKPLDNTHDIQLNINDRFYSFSIVKLEEMNFHLLYGTDITDTKDKEMILSKLSKYFSPQVYSSIFSGQLDVNISTNRKNLTVFFSDIKGFTTITERLEPEQLTDIITFYLTEMTNIATEFGGTVDKYIGDAIMIFFGDPNSNGNKADAIACVAMALKMQKKLITIRKKWEQLGITEPLEVRMGIHTDICTVGNFGSNNRLDYTVLGNGVNLASRLESLAEPNKILISENTYNIIKEDIHCEYQDEIIVKGKSHPIKMFNVIKELKKISDQNIIDIETDGFLLSINQNNINDRETILKYLRDSLKKIEEG
jgi:class 3 adenylate cyclase